MITTKPIRGYWYHETYEKLKIYLPRCKKEIGLSITTDDWRVHSVSYGNRDEMTELVNLILELKFKAESKP